MALTRELGDPLLSEIVVTEVSLSDDLGVADVSVRLLSDDSTDRRRAAVRALRRASHKLQRSVGGKLALKKTPALRFRYDVGHDAARRVDELLREIAAEPSSNDSDPPGD
jgi:ribosome-binding factor A